VVRCTFSPARAWRPAVVTRLARTLGFTKGIRTMSLDSPYWQGLGAIISIAGVLATFVVYWLQRPTRRLIYTIGAPSPLLNVPDPGAHRIEVLVNGEPVPEPQLVLVKVKNAGRTDLDPTDFVEPFQVNFGSGATLHSVVVLRTEPPELNARFVRQSSQFALQPLLLNRGDLIEVLCLVSNASPEPTVSARVKGIKRVSKVSEEEFSFKATARSFSVAFLGGLTISFVVTTIASIVIKSFR
jgi:hypothetical protein